MISGADFGGALLGLVDVYRWAIALYAGVVFDRLTLGQALRRLTRVIVFRLIIVLIVVLSAELFREYAVLAIAADAAVAYVLTVLVAGVAVAALVALRDQPQAGRFMLWLSRQAAGSYPEKYEKWRQSLPGAQPPPEGS